MKNYKEYLDYCKSLAEDINDNYPDTIEILDRIHEIADGCQHVIYYSKAWDLVNMMREYNSELFMQAIEEMEAISAVEENRTHLDNDIHKLMTWIAYILIRNGIQSAYESSQVEEVTA